ncbi:MAG: tetratricopeptide (TPR) repeat protein [Lentimonas sp.]|jgi:tetratricopeptide (TPR) repeat protein
MTNNKKPVILVAIVLIALMIIPVIVLMMSRDDDPSPENRAETPLPAGSSTAAHVDYDLRQLAERAEKLLSDDLAVALRKGDVSLDFIAALNKDAEKARDALGDGKLEKAETYFRSVVETAEAQLGALTLAETARALNESTYAELKSLEYLKSAFENTYREAVETYNQGLRDLNAGQYQESISGFEMTGAILGDLEGRSIQQVGGMLEAANTALAELDLAGARSAFEQVLQIDSGNIAAGDGLAMVNALEGISTEVEAIQALEAAGELDTALGQLDALLSLHPNNPFLLNELKVIEAQVLEREFNAALERAAAAEAGGDLLAAVAEMEAANAMRPSSELSARLEALKGKSKAARLEVLLETSYNALQAGRYDAARKLYKQAVALDPESKEARTGLEKASSLYLANIRYSQNMESAAKYLKTGRFPLSAKFFNDAMRSRPSTVPLSQIQEESRIRTELAVQSQEVSVHIVSDKKTYVSMIGVFAPERMKEKDLKLYPDVYKYKGTRKGYRTIEIEFKVDARNPVELEVICTDKL